MTRATPSADAASPRAAIRRASPRDLDRVVTLWIGLTEHHAAFEPRFALRAGAENEVGRLIGAQLRDPDVAIFVHEASDAAPSVPGPHPALSGFCAVRIDRAPPICAEAARAEITEVAVCASLRRRGIGRALVEAALHWVRERGVDHVEARVVSRNPEGQHFWRSLGFGVFVDVLHRRL